MKYLITMLFCLATMILFACSEDPDPVVQAEDVVSDVSGDSDTTPQDVATDQESETADVEVDDTAVDATED
tara:strand:- start:622 stop:834 length:213 start_codon:yes stop_codon:yes gene_type:complete